MITASLPVTMRVMWWTSALLRRLSTRSPLSTGLLPALLALTALLTWLLTTLSRLVALAVVALTPLSLATFGRRILPLSLLASILRLPVLRVPSRGPATSPAAVSSFLG